MHSCILRSRGRARWLALHDVDEFFQVSSVLRETVHLLLMMCDARSQGATMTA